MFSILQVAKTNKLRVMLNSPLSCNQQPSSPQSTFLIPLHSIHSSSFICPLPYIKILTSCLNSTSRIPFFRPSTLSLKPYSFMYGSTHIYSLPHYHNNLFTVKFKFLTCLHKIFRWLSITVAMKFKFLSLAVEGLQGLVTTNLLSLSPHHPPPHMSN